MTAPRPASPGQPADAGQGTAHPAVPRQYGAQPEAGADQSGGAGQPRSAGQAQTPPSPGPERYGSGLPALSRLAWPVVAAAALGVLAVGVLLLAWPSATLLVVAILLGVALLVSGLRRLFEGFTAREASGGTRAAYVIIGLVAVAAGLFCLRHHDVTIFLLAFLVGAYWIMHGIADLAVAATSGPAPGRWLMAIGGLVAIAAGAVVLFWPGISLVLLLTVLGAWLLLYGVMLAVLAFRLMRESRHAPQPA